MKYKTLEERAVSRRARPRVHAPEVIVPDHLHTTAWGPTSPPLQTGSGLPIQRKPLTLVYVDGKLLSTSAYQWRNGRLHLRKNDAEGKAIRIVDVQGKEVLLTKANLVLA